MSELQDGSVGDSGCGANFAAEPAVHVSRDGTVFLGSELGTGFGSDLWRGPASLADPSAASACLEFRGQPNSLASSPAGPVDPSGGDLDLALGTNHMHATSPGQGPDVGLGYPLYVASLNAGSVSVARSSDNGATFQTVPVAAGLPADDREWIAAYGDGTSLLTFHDGSGSNIDVMRSDDSDPSTPPTYRQIAVAIPPSQANAPLIASNQHGNLVIDRDNLDGTTPPPDTPPGNAKLPAFWAYQAFAAPADANDPSLPHDQVYVSASNDGGYTWSVHPVGCNTPDPNKTLDHIFPILSVAPDGHLWAAWSDDTSVFTAVSPDHGQTWTCSGAVSTTTATGQAIFPWIVATSAGVDLVYYAARARGGDGPAHTYHVYFAQNLSSAPGGWGTPEQLMAVHQGDVCEDGATCTSDRQLFDDFGVDVDAGGWAHIAFSSDADPSTGQVAVGQSGSATGYAVQTGGTHVGSAN